MRPTEIKIALQTAFDIRTPIMMWGSPGIGKSAVVRQVAAQAGRHVQDIRLALLDPTDLRGIPFYNPEKNTAEWAVASILPDGKDNNDVLFLDEINAAPPAIQAAAYQLVLDRKIGDYELPEGVDIIAAGNREGDKAVTFKMPSPLLNRFIHLDFEVEYEDWHDWALQHGVHEHIVGYIGFKKTALNQFDKKGKGHAFATPRSWEFASRVVNAEPPETILRQMLTGAVGEGSMLEYMAYEKVYRKIPDPSKILDGAIKEMPKNPSLSAEHAVVNALTYELHHRFGKANKKVNKAWLESASNYIDFIHNQFSPELAVAGLRDALKNFGLPMVQAPNWKNFAKDYTHLVMAA